MTSRQQQTQRTLLDRLQLEYGIEEPGKMLLPVAARDSDISGKWVDGAVE